MPSHSGSQKPDSPTRLAVVGGGLAGCEAAWQAAQRGVPVDLYEMRPHATTPAHSTDRLAELVCSNSLGSTRAERASGLLKNELQRLGSLLVPLALQSALPAGHALAVDRDTFADKVTSSIERHPRINLIRREITSVPEPPVVLATGPLTSDSLATDLARLADRRHLFFYDALAPIVTAESIDMSVAFRQSRYDRGETTQGDYINCPLSQDEFEAFVGALLAAGRIELASFETDDEQYFEGCLPIEVLAERGEKSLSFGPMRPVGLTDPRTGRRPYAVVQLRQDDAAASLFNLVGFQTNLRWPEQKRVLRMIPGLAEAEFVRLGQMHRNTYVNSPALLDANLELRSRPGTYVTGQLCGIEGYVGNIGAGLVAGANAARMILGLPPAVPPPNSMLGALCNYVTSADPTAFQPMKANFGILPQLVPHVRKKADRYAAYAERAMHETAEFTVESRWFEGIESGDST